MQEEGVLRAARRSLFFGDVEKQLESSAQDEYAELNLSLSEMDEETTEDAILQMTPVPKMSVSFIGEKGFLTQVAVVDDLETFILVTPMKKGKEEEDEEPSTPRTPLARRSMFIFTPRANRKLFTPLTKADVLATPGEIAPKQEIVAETPVGRLRLSFIPETGAFYNEDTDEEEEEEEVEEGGTVEQTGRRFGRRFSFVIWEDSPGSGASSMNGAPTRERMTITACSRQSLVCGQVYSAREGIVSRGIRSIVATTVVEGNEVHSTYAVVSMENRTEAERLVDESKNILVDPKVVGRVMIFKKEFVESRTYGVAAVRVSNTLLLGEDRRFAYILPVAGERESGFFYVNVEYYNRGLGGLLQFPIFSIGFNVRFLAFFVTEINFDQRFNVEISPGLVVTIVMKGQVTKGLSYRLTGMRSFQPKKELVVDSSITLSLTSIKIHYPLDWFEVFPKVALNIPGYRARRGTIPAPRFGINCDACKVFLERPLRCKGCMESHYCSKECQTEAWAGGHKLVCGKKK